MNDLHQEPNTRARIIDAAYLILAEKGYAAATIKEIARFARIAPGLVYYYFADKDELFLAVLREATERHGEECGCTGDPSPNTWTFSLTLPATVEEAPSRRPNQVRLRYALFALGLSNPKFLPALGEMLASGRRGLERELCTNGGTSSAPALSAVLLACIDGLALQRVADPDFDLASAFDVLRRMVEVCK